MINEEGPMGMHTLEGVLNTFPETVNAFTSNIADGETMFNALVATLAAKGVYKFGKAALGAGYNKK